jgi:glucan endo-1,3-alpha-glucosidase
MHFSFLFSTMVATAAWFQVANARTVFAHFIMDNAYAYTPDQWSKDIAAAQQIGIDGFALNWHAPDCSPDMQWTIARIDDAFKIARKKGFKLMHSFDMSHAVCDTFWNQTFMQHMIDKHGGNSTTFRWDDNILVSTYGGDQVPQYGNRFFQGLKKAMNSTNAITLAPALTRYSYSAQRNAHLAAIKLVNDYPSIDGYLNWQAWPLDTPNELNVAPDRIFQSALKKTGRAGPCIMGEWSADFRPGRFCAPPILSISTLTMAIQGSQRRQLNGCVGPEV